MDEYIRRGAAIEETCSDCTERNICGGSCSDTDRLRAIPAADVVEVRHGRWINGRCSECGEHAPFWQMASTYHLSKYCHGCGAKMDGGQDDGT